MPATIQRGWGFTDDVTAGGSGYDTIIASFGGVIPDAVNFWPVTGGSNNKNLKFVDRTDEVRGHRAASPKLPFQANGVMTVPVPTYRSVLEKAFKKVLGGTDTVGTVATNINTHAIASLAFGATQLPAVHAQLVRDDYNLKMSGTVFNKLSCSFPLDAEGSAEAELMGLYFDTYATAMPAVTFTGLSSDVMMLRDAAVYIDGASSASEIQSLVISGVPTGGTFTLSFRGQTTTALAWNATGTVVNTAFQLLSTVGATGCVVTGGPAPTPYVFTFGGQLANTDVPLVQVNITGLTGGTPAAAMTVTQAGGNAGTSIPDLQGFEFSFANNVAPKWYARRNVVTRTIGSPAAVKKLWHPTENKVSAAQDVTYAINLGNVNTAQEIAQEYAQIQKFVFEVEGGTLATTVPIVNEMLRVTIYNAVHNDGQGAQALSARDDITSRFEGNGFYSTADGTDVKVEVVNNSATPIT